MTPWGSCLPTLLPASSSFLSPRAWDLMVNVAGCPEHAAGAVYLRKHLLSQAALSSSEAFHWRGWKLLRIFLSFCFQMGYYQSAITKIWNVCWAFTSGKGPWQPQNKQLLWHFLHPHLSFLSLISSHQHHHCLYHAASGTGVVSCSYPPLIYFSPEKD